MPNGSRAQSRGDDNAGSVEAFMEGWLVRQGHYLDELLSAEQRCHECRVDEDLKGLIYRILAHYQQYYEEKARVAHQNIFNVLSPTWFTSFERTFLWIAGFKPGLAFRVVEDSVNDLSEEQIRRMRRLIGETRVEERKLNDELAKIQESVAAPPLMAMAKQRGRLGDVEMVEEPPVPETLRSAMESVVASADLLRTDTVARVAEILNPGQSVKFLTAVAQLQLRIRSWGLQKDAERG